MTRPHDHGQPTTGPTGPYVRRRLPGQTDRAVRVDGQNRVRDQRRSPVAAPCGLNDENSRAKVQDVRGDIPAEPQALGDVLDTLTDWECREVIAAARG